MTDSVQEPLDGGGLSPSTSGAMTSARAIASFLGAALLIAVFAAGVGILLPGVSRVTRPYLQAGILGSGLGSVGALLLVGVRGGRFVQLVSIMGLSVAMLHPLFQPLIYDGSLGPLVAGWVVGGVFMVLSNSRKSA